MRFSMKAILTAVFALISFVAVAPAAHADGGTLNVLNQNYTLNTLSFGGSNNVDATVQLSPATIALFLGDLTGKPSTLTIVSGGTTYTFTGAVISSLGEINLWNDTINVDFKYKSETSSSSVPEPATTMLIGCGLLALALVTSRKMLRA
jgi:hypothetical protein